jgi:Derlin-2/3
MDVLGVLNFKEVFVPWVHVGLVKLMHGLPLSDLVEIPVGHIYWFFDDIYPRFDVSQGQSYDEETRM